MVTGLVSMACANTMVGFFVANWATFLQMSQFGPGRALITKSVDEDEVGKVKRVSHINEARKKMN